MLLSESMEVVLDAEEDDDEAEEAERHFRIKLSNTSLDNPFHPASGMCSGRFGPERSVAL